MKREYLLALPKPTDIKNQAYNTYLSSVQSLFAKLQKNYDKQECETLWQQIKKLNDIRSIKKVHKKPIYQFFLKRELLTLDYIKGGTNVDYQIMKITKCKLEGFKLDWKQTWERIIKEVPQVSNTGSKAIQNFIKHIRPFFDQNNALNVWQYFDKTKTNDLQKFIHLFINITSQTKQQVINSYAKVLINKCKIYQIANSQFLIFFQKLQRSRKHIKLSPETIQFLNDNVLQLILAGTQSSKKTSFQNNFNAVSAELLQKVIGKANPGSIKLLQIIFSFVKKFVRPLENSTKSVMFIYWFFKSLFHRVQSQKRTKQKLKKLLQKRSNLKDKQQSKKQDDDDLDNQTKIQQIVDKKEQQKKEDAQQQAEEEQQDIDSEDQQDESQQLNNLTLGGGRSLISFDKDQNQNDKADTDEQKIQKMERMLANEITDQILQNIEQQVEQIFQVIYYVNSKKTISHLLRYIYRLFPKFAIKSFEVLSKAANIPNINEDGLVRNLTVSVQHMFMPQNYIQGVNSVMKVLQKAYNSRRIIDVWRIYQSILSKIPLLDQKDLQAIPEIQKQKFQKTFGINHDRFYNEYSDHMEQAFKRLLRQGQFLEKNHQKNYSTTMQLIFVNSYPQMKKRILSQVMEVLQQKPNPLALYYFQYANLPAKQYQILKNQFHSLNDQNSDTQQLRVRFLIILSKNMSLSQFKIYIRKMAEKGRFDLIQEYAGHRLYDQVKWEPFKTTLNYLYEDPKITIQFVNSIDKRKQCLKQMQNYRDQLINEATIQIQKMVADENQDSVSQRIIKSYTIPSKVTTLQARKKIFELLSIVHSITYLLQEKLINIKNTKKLELVDSQVSPYGFLDINKPFSKQIIKILKIQQVLHDPKLISIINALLTNQYFLYFDIQITEYKKQMRQRKKSKNHEAPGCVNIVSFGNQYISQARKFMAHLLHKTHGGTKYDIRGKTDELFILSMINSNDSYKDIRSMFEQSHMIRQYRQYLINLMKYKTQNRELIKRVSSTIDFLTKREVSFIKYNDDEILQFVDYHATLMQSQDSKVKQNALKSFRKFAKIIGDIPISDTLTQSMLKYRKTQKMQLIWTIYVAALIKHSDFLTQNKQIIQKRINSLLPYFQGIILHDLRSVRRVSVYIYPSLIRMLKKINLKYQTKSIDINKKYQQKSLQDFIESGYLRPEFQRVDIKNKTLHKKHPQNTYLQKLTQKSQKKYFDFLINNQENANKFIKNYHSDLASTAEMMLSAMQSAASNIDLFAIASKAIQKIVYFYKVKDMTLSRSEIFVGVKFFKYLCIQDANAGYKFHNYVKDFVLSCLSNMQSLDNQTLVILYSYSLINAYQANFTNRIPQIQGFLTKILVQIISKSSKPIYSKLQAIFFKKIKNQQALKFVEELCQKMINENKKINRAGYLLGKVRDQKYSITTKLLHKLFDQKIQLEHQSSINAIIDFLLNYPELSAWNIQQIEQTKIINYEKLKQQNKVKHVLDQFVLFTNKQVQNYLLSSFKSMLQGQSVQMMKTGYTFLNHTIQFSTQLFMHDDVVSFVAELIKLQLKMLVQKKQLQLDFKSGNKAMSYLFGSMMLKPQNFQKFMTIVLEQIQPTKKSCDLLIQLLNSPVNYIKLSNQLIEKYVRKILDFQSNSSLYKQLLIILSTFFRYRIDAFQKFKNKEQENKNKRALVLQAYLLAQNANLDPTLVKQTLKISQKDRKNIWARQMLLIRGQRQYFDKQQSYEVWREIKQLSNPYHYHA